MTLVKPFSIALLHVSGLLPWSWCMTIGNLGIQLGRREHQVAQIVVLRVRAGAAARLDDHRRLGLASGLHDRLDLLHVVHVEGGQTVVVLGGVIQKQTHRYQGHDSNSSNVNRNNNSRPGYSPSGFAAKDAPF